MSGIYIHIPFCAKKCSYCDFYTQIAPGLIDPVVDSIVKEIEIRKDYLSDKHIQTVYFGGGTPSLLKAEHFNRIFKKIEQNFNVDKNAEISFEANPDDLSNDYFNDISSLPFNRISIGIQSFFDDELENIRRRHSGQQAIEAVRRAQDYGFKNLSIDLIFGLPNQTFERWESNIQKALSLNVQHISAYGLTYEEGTALFQQRKRGIVKEIPDDQMVGMYEMLVEKLAEKGFNRYEISNFALSGYKSRHNSSYWEGIHYLGLGPSAHSYNGHERQWNISSNRKYLDNISAGKDFFEKETLTPTDKYNDYVMVNIRKADGINKDIVLEQFGIDFLSFLEEEIADFIKNELIILENNHYKLSAKGIHITNTILESIFRI